MLRLFTRFNNLYPVWLVGLATVAFLRPLDDPLVRHALDLRGARGVNALHGAVTEPRRLSRCAAKRRGRRVRIRRAVHDHAAHRLAKDSPVNGTSATVFRLTD